MNLFITKLLASATLIVCGVALWGPNSSVEAQQGLFANHSTNQSHCDGTCQGGCTGNCNGAGVYANDCQCQPRCVGRCRNSRGHRCNNDCQRCPQCNEEYCCLKTECGKESKKCYEIDYKTICIPKVNPPWKKGCQPQCAEARSVKVLKTKSYECPKCKYTWEVVKPQLPQIGEPTPAAAAAQYGAPPIIQPGHSQPNYRQSNYGQQNRIQPNQIRPTLTQPTNTYPRNTGAFRVPVPQNRNYGYGAVQPQVPYQSNYQQKAFIPRAPASSHTWQQYQNRN